MCSLPSTQADRPDGSFGKTLLQQTTAAGLAFVHVFVNRFPPWKIFVQASISTDYYPNFVIGGLREVCELPAHCALVLVAGGIIHPHHA